MAKMGKRLKDVYASFDKLQKYSFEDAYEILKKAASKNFDESVDLHFNLGVDPRKSDQMVRGVAVLPHGTGKKIKVLAIVPPEKVEEAKEAGADYVGGEEYIDRILKEGWLDFDKVVTTPSMMSKVGKLGRVLGRRGMMPSPKNGTVTNNIAAAIKQLKAGSVDFKVNKNGVLACTIGKMSFGKEKLYENALELIRSVLKAKPPAAKGTYIKKVTVSSTMGPGVKLDESELTNAVK